MRPTIWALFVWLPVLLLAGCPAAEPPAAVPEPPAAVPQSPALPEALESFPYVNFSPVEERFAGKSGTTVFNEALASSGYNLYVPQSQYGALLIDLRGKVVHRWASDEGRPDADVEKTLAEWSRGWNAVTLTAAGELLVIVSRGSILKLDWNSRLIWKLEIRAHHDLVVAADGTIYTLAEEIRRVSDGRRARVILDHQIVILSDAGRVLRRISLYDVFMRSPGLAQQLQARIDRRFENLEAFGIDHRIEGHDIWTAERLAQLEKLLRTGETEVGSDEAISWLRAIVGEPSDVFHANAILSLRADKRGLWQDGDLLFSIRNGSLIGVIDSRRQTIIWSLGGGLLDGQHQPSILANGNVLVFDNGLSRKNSRVLEIEPRTQAVVWSYDPAPPERFYTAMKGGCQVLPNDNILVTDANNGRAFEVTRDQRIVWEYFNPLFDESGDKRSEIYRMTRYEAAAIESLLARHAPITRPAPGAGAR